MFSVNMANMVNVLSSLESTIIIYDREFKDGHGVCETTHLASRDTTAGLTLNSGGTKENIVLSQIANQPGLAGNQSC